MKRLLFCFIISLTVFSACNSSSINSRIRVENKTGKNVVCLLCYNYPDLSFDFTSKEAIMAKMRMFEVSANQTKEIDTLGLCDKKVWDDKIKHSMLMLFVLDKDKLAGAAKLEDALIERYYFSYIQITKAHGLINIE